MLRKLGFLVAFLALSAAGIAVWAWQQHGALLADRNARIATLAPIVADATPVLDLNRACALAEHELLSRPVDRALRVDCSAAALEEKPGGARLLSGVLSQTKLDNALLGGGFRLRFCLAQTATGWTIIGRPFDLDECSFTVPPGTTAERIRALATAGMAERGKALAESAIDGVRHALATHPAFVSDVCEGLTSTSSRELGVVDARVLGGEPESGRAVNFTSQVFRACLPGAEDPEACSLREAWRYVLVLGDVQAEPARATGAREFTGGSWEGTLQLIDVASARVLCARPVSYQLRASTAPSYDYSRGVGEAVCQGVHALTEGQVSLDPFWCR